MAVGRGRGLSRLRYLKQHSKAKRCRKHGGRRWKLHVDSRALQGFGLVEQQLAIIDHLIVSLLATRSQVAALRDILDIAWVNYGRSAPDVVDVVDSHGPVLREMAALVEPQKMALLFHAYAEIDQFQCHVSALHQTYLDKQAPVLPACFQRASSLGRLRLQVGANSEHAVPGWVSLGLDPGAGSGSSPVIQMAITAHCTAFPLPTSSCAFVYASHLLEHLAYPELVDRALTEIGRVPCPGGVLRLVVPNAEMWLKAHVAHAYKDNPSGIPFSGPFWDAVRKHWPFWDLAPSDPFARAELGVVASYLGSGGGVEAAISGEHQMAYDFAVLSATLVTAGFVQIQRSEFNSSVHAELVDIDSHSSVANAAYIEPDGSEEPMSLFMEARRLG